jgi:DNA-binding NarL/FixJ family response regulator
MKIVREGGHYISPKVQKLINRLEWPDTKSRMTKRQKECLVMLCCGCTTNQIGEMLHITRSTVYNHLDSLYSSFHVACRAEMVALAWEMELVTSKDIRLYNKKKEHSPLP